MPVTPTYPGVYIQEIPSGSRTITGVATAVAAFVGRAARGPVDDPVQITSLAQYERIFGGLTRDAGMGYAVRDYYLNGGRQAVIVRLEAGALPAQVKVGDDLTLVAHGPGAWGDALEVEVRHASDPEDGVVAGQQGVAKDKLFHLTIREGTLAEPVQTETYANVTLCEGPRRLDTVLAGSALARVSTALPLDPGDRPDELFATVDAPDDVYASGGEGADSTLVLTSDHYAAAGFDDAKRGLYALRDADLFTILILPPSVPDEDTPEGLWDDAAALCVEERALLLLDPPADMAVDAIKGWSVIAGLAAVGRNAAIYFPRIRRADPARDGAIGEFTPSGAVAGIMARTDSTRGVWKAPAGIEAGVVGASGLSVPLTDGESGILNPLGINCLRTFPVIGTVVWGARTLRGADAFADDYKYVPVRRLALFLEETLFRNTQWVVFEPNDEPLWAQIRTSIGAFMQDLFRQGAFQGITPRDAYFVRCDAETTTQFDIDRGIVNIVVGFAPLKPAEFVIVSIQQKTATAPA